MGFLNYLDEYEIDIDEDLVDKETKIYRKKKIVTKEACVSKKKPKKFIKKQIVKESISKKKKPVVRNAIKISDYTDHASSILGGMSDDCEIVMEATAQAQAPQQPAQQTNDIETTSRGVTNHANSIL